MRNWYEYLIFLARLIKATIEGKTALRLRKARLELERIGSELRQAAKRRAHLLEGNGGR